MELFDQLHPWHWFVVAVILIVLEVLTVSGFLLGMAIAALVVAAMLFLIPALVWGWQLLWFGLLAMVLTLGYRKFFRSVNDATDNPLLNDRAAQLVGKTFVLGIDLDRSGADMLGDTRWSLSCNGRIAKGTRVKVVGVDGMVLNVQEDV
jgi:membrane protein implicated in regulation of membrane protease activity